MELEIKNWERVDGWYIEPATETRYCYIGSRVCLGNDVQLGAGVRLGDDVQLGACVRLGDDVQRLFEELRASYHEQARGLLDGGADLLLVETISVNNGPRTTSIPTTRKSNLRAPPKGNRAPGYQMKRNSVNIASPSARLKLKWPADACQRFKLRIVIIQSPAFSTCNAMPGR